MTSVCPQCRDTGREAVERFISMYQSGEQGCHMDHDEAQALSKSLRALLAALEAAEADAHALVAEACEEMVNQAVDMADGRDEAAYIEDRMRDAIPADAIAAREARDRHVREQAIREAAENLKAHAPHLVDGPEHDVGSHYGYHAAVDRILALIEKDKTNDG